MTEQSTLLLIRLDTNRLQLPIVGQLRMQTLFLWTRTPKYPRLHISVNDIS